MKALFNTIHYLLIIAIIGVGVLLLGTLVPIPGNFKVKIVQSGSMEPVIKTGSIVVIRPEERYAVGDIVTFGKDTKTQVPTTHRIVAISGEGLQKVISTKGDANDAKDPSDSRYADIIGKVLFSLPYVGFILDFARKPLGFALLVGVPALSIIVDEILKIVREVQRLRRKKKSLDSFEREQGTERRLSVDGMVPKPEKSVVHIKEGEKHSTMKMIVVTILTAGSLFGFSTVGGTVSYFSDSEISIGNMLKAGILGFSLSADTDSAARVADLSVADTSTTTDATSSPEEEEYAVGSESFVITAGESDGSLPVLFDVTGILDSDNPKGCESLSLDSLIGERHYSGLFKDFLEKGIATTSVGQFTLSLPTENSPLAPDMVCGGALVFHAYLANVPDAVAHVFSDEKRYTFELKNYPAPPPPPGPQLFSAPITIDPFATETPPADPLVDNGTGSSTENAVAPEASTTDETIPPPQPENTDVPPPENVTPTLPASEDPVPPTENQDTQVPSEAI